MRNGIINYYSEHPWVKDGKTLGAQAGDEFLVTDEYSIGFLGYYAGPRVHIVDHYGLANALIARIPAIRREEWRIGHFDREIPDGYLAYLETNDIDQIENADIRQYVGYLNQLIIGNVWNYNRLGYIWSLNSGAYDHLIESAFSTD